MIAFNPAFLPHESGGFVGSYLAQLGFERHPVLEHTPDDWLNGLNCAIIE